MTRARLAATLRRRARWALALLAVGACGPGGPLGGALEPPTPHERYARALRDAGLAGTALGGSWLAAAGTSLHTAAAVPLPFRESGYFAQGEARAVAYRVRVRRGQRVTAAAEARGAGDGAAPALFVDVFAAPLDTAAAPEAIVSADSGASQVTFVAARDGEYVVRVQPELLRDVGYVVRIDAGPSLAFPVQGRDSRAVRSAWGAARDGGARAHQGIDIFAPRGTPVLSAGDGTAWVGDNRLGGRVVFVRDGGHGVSAYYAHLDSQHVHSGERVRAGDTLGFVGTTGNARGGPPHLHFGIYARGEGAIDPFPWVDTRRAPSPPLGRDTTWVRRLARTRRADAVVRAAPADAAPAVRAVERYTALAVDGAAARGWLRVRLPDRTEGWMRTDAVERADVPMRHARLAGDVAVRAHPAPDAPAMRTVATPTLAPVLGRFAGYVLVELDGARGWVMGD